MSLKISIFQEFILYEEKSFILFHPTPASYYLFIYFCLDLDAKNYIREKP